MPTVFVGVKVRIDKETYNDLRAENKRLAPMQDVRADQWVEVIDVIPNKQGGQPTLSVRSCGGGYEIHEVPLSAINAVRIWEEGTDTLDLPVS